MSEQQSLFGRKLHADLEIEDELWEAAGVVKQLVEMRKEYFDEDERT